MANLLCAERAVRLVLCVRPKKAEGRRSERASRTRDQEGRAVPDGPVRSARVREVVDMGVGVSGPIMLGPVRHKVSFRGP